MKEITARSQRLIVVLAAVLAVMFGMAGYANAAAPAAKGIKPPVSLQSARDMPFVPIQAYLHSSARSAAEPAATGEPFTCGGTPSSTPASVSYDSGSPAMLARIDWTGSGGVDCTIPMTALSFEIYVVDPAGTTHTVSQASCGECSNLSPVNTKYSCLQDAQDCSGGWQQGYHAVYEAPAGETFTSATSSCPAKGSILTCDYRGFRGDFSLFQLTAPYCPAAQTSQHYQVPLASSGTADEGDCYNLPPNKAIPLLDEEAITEIRDYHFAGGAHVDDTKGLFYSTLTNRDLGKIWDAGMKDTGAWTLNSTGYYEKTFPYSGAGTQSVTKGRGLPATKVTLVVARYVDNTGYGQVITMYPATG